MSSRIRFADAADVFAAFPQLEQMAARPDRPCAPLDYALGLAGSPRPVAALAFLAHLLPRREAVWWACQCVSAIQGAAAQDEGLRLATHWVRDPNETTRRDALTYSRENLRAPTSWLARAVGYSGGSLLAPDQPAMPAAPEACAQSVNAAVVLAAVATPPSQVLSWMRACAEAGVRFASGEDARVVRPAGS